MHSQDTWRQRRRFLIVTTIFCMLTIAYCIWKAEDLRIYETAITMAFLTLGGILTAYTGVAAWEDINNAKVNGHGKNGGN